MFWKRKPPREATIENCARALFQALADGLKKGGRIRAEDMIAATASVTAEACISAAGDFNPRKHQFAPGARLFSTKVNELFSGDTADESIDGPPALSIVGMLRDKLLASGYDKSDFPPLKVIFQDFAARIGKPSDWGRVPLSVPAENVPSILPLQVAYETRPTVDRIFQPLTNAQEKLHAAVLTLAEALIAVRAVIDRKIALLLALQIVNGMAKTAPMRDEAMEAARKKPSGSQ